MTPSVPFEQVTGSPLERLESVGGRVTNLYRLLANHPEILDAWVAFAWSLRRQAETSRAMRELMILRSAQVHGASLQLHDHTLMALAAGASEDQIAELEDWRSSASFDPPTLCALALTEEMIRGRVEDTTLDELAEHFGPAERIELIVTAGFYCMVPRVLDALRLEAPEGS